MLKIDLSLIVDIGLIYVPGIVQPAVLCLQEGSC